MNKKILLKFMIKIIKMKYGNKLIMFLINKLIIVLIDMYV